MKRLLEEDAPQQQQETEEVGYVKATLHCVGVVTLAKVGPCLLMMQAVAPSAFYCVSLTEKTSDLVSPLYEHRLCLSRQPNSLCEENKALLTLFTGGVLFMVEKRLTCRYRLDTQYKQKDLNKRIRELVGNTFFLEIDRSFTTMRDDATATRLMNPLFMTPATYPQLPYAYMNCSTDDEEAGRLKGYLTLYNQCSEKRYRTKKTLYENYWTEMIALQQKGNSLSALDTAVNHFMAFTKAECLYQKSDIVILFNGWKQYKAIASYFTHHATTMEYTYALHKTLADAPPLLTNKLWLLASAQRNQLYEFCCTFMKRLLTEKQPLQLLPQDINLSLFDAFPVENAPLAGHLYTVLSLVIKQQERLAQDALIQKLKLPMLTQCIVSRLEAQAKGKATANNATLDAINVEQLYAAYQVFTGALPPLDQSDFLNLAQNDDEDQEEDAAAIAVMDDSDAEEPTIDIDPWGHHVKDFTRFLQYLYKSPPPDWLVKPQKTLLVKANTVLFFIAPVVHTLELERDTSIIVDKFLLGKANISLKFHQSEPIKPTEWQADWLVFKETAKDVQQYQFMLFTPLELMRNEDLAVIKHCLFEDLFNTSILRETGDVFFVKRLSHYFAETQQELRMSIFHREHCIGSSHFVTIRDDAVKETVIIPQCHTLSLGAMKNLLTWLILNKRVIKRVVMMGSPFVLPCLAHGEAFLDLLRQLQPGDMNRHVYDRDARRDDLLTVINKYWRTLKCDALRHFPVLKQQELKYIAGGFRSLYQVKSLALFTEMISAMPEKAHIYCLYKSTKNVLLDQLNKATDKEAKLKERYAVENLPIGQLCLYNCIPATAVSNLFVMTKKTLFSLEKNEYFYLFMLSEKIYVIESADMPASKGELLPELIANIKERKKPNMRYSYLSSTL